MTENNTSTLEPFDREIEWTLRRLRNLVEEKVSPNKKRPTMEETRVLGAVNIVGVGNRAAVGAAVGAVGVENPTRTLMEYAQPSIEGTASCIRIPAVHANNLSWSLHMLTWFRIQSNSMECPMKILISI